MRGLSKTLGALFAASVLAAPAWAAEIIVDEATGLPADSNYTPETTFSTVSSAIGTSDAHIKLSANADQSIDGVITAASVYIEKPRWQIDFDKTVNLKNAGAIYVKGQLFAQTWRGGATGNIELANDLFIAPNTTANRDYGTIRVGDEGDLTLTGMVTILPNTSTVTIGGKHSGGKRFTLSRLDLSKLASIEERTSAALTIGGKLNCTFSEGSTINLPAGCTGTVKVIAMGTGTLSGFDSSHITVTCGGAALPNGYSAIFKAGGKIEIRNNDTLVDGATFSTTAQDGTSKMSWSTLGGVDSQCEYVNTTLAIHFTADNQTFTFDNTQDVYLTSLTVTAAEGVTGGTIAFPTTEGLVIATTTAINTNVTATGKGTLGAVTIDAGKTLTVPKGVALASLSGSGILNLDVGKSTTLENYALNTFSGTTKISSGTLKYTAAANRPAGAILVSGENAALQIATNTDILGHSNGLPGITIENGGRFEAFRRDTFSRVLTLKSGHLVFSADNQDSSRSFDLYNNSKIVSSGTSTIGGKNATNDAESNDPIVASGIIAIRRRNLAIEVTDGTLSVYSEIGTAPGNDGSVYKTGAGTLALYRAATSALPVVVEAGELRLVRNGSLTTGAMTVNANATLAYVGTQAPTNTLTNNGTIAADGEGTEVNLTGATLSGSGTYAVKNGATLILPAGKEGTMEVPEGATLALVLSSEQLAFEYVSHATGTGTIVFKKEVDGTLVDVTAEDGTTKNGTFTPKLNTWEGDSATEAGVYQWSDVNNWSKGRVPAAGDRVVVALGDGIGTPTLTADTPEVELSITGKGSLNLAGFTLTAKRIKGESEASTALTLAGTGKVQLNASTTLERKTLEKLSLTVPSGVTLATKLTGSDGNPIFADVAITFAAGASWESYGWLELADTVTVTNAGDLALAMVNGAQPSLSGSGKLKKRGAGTLTVNGMGDTHENPLVIEAGTLNLTTGTGSTATFTGGISGDGALKIGSGTVVLTQANTYNGGTEIAEGATLKLTATSAQTLSGNISGAGKLVIGDGTAASSVTLNGTLGTVTGEVESAQATCALALEVASGSTLTLNNTVATTLAGALSGSGAIILGGTGEVNVTAANGEYNGTITINSGATLTNKDHGQPIPFGKGRIVNNGKLKLIAGTILYGCALLPPTSGTGDIVFCSGSETRIPAPITTTGTITFEAASGNKAAAKVTFVKNTTDFDGKVASISGANVVVGSGVTLAKDEASKPLITIANGKTLSGTGVINVPVTLNGTLAAGAEITFGKAISVGEGATLSGKATFAAGSVLSSAATFTGDVSFEAGATIDASSATIAFNAKVTLPETGVVKVKPNGSYATIIMANLGGLRASAFVFDESVAETYAGYCLGTPLYSPSSEEKTQFLMLLKKPTVAAGTSDEVVSAIARAVADDYGFSNWQLTSAEAIGNATLDGAALFGHVTALDEQDSKVAKVSYDFGVDWLTVTADDKVVIRAKVASSAVSGVSATILSSTTVKVQQLTGTNAEGNPVWADVTSAELTSTEIEALGQTSDGATRYLSIERPSGLATFSYRVVATDAASN